MGGIIMATIIKCDICGAEGAKHVRTIVYKPFTTDVKYKEVGLDMCKNCMSKATNLQADYLEKEFHIQSAEEEFHLNEGYINIYEADGKEELRTSCRVYKTLDKALKEKEAHCDDEYYLKTIKISW